MSNGPKPAFEELVERARKGTNADWAFIDTNLGPEHLTAERVRWAMLRGLIDKESSDVRDLAATILAKSDVEIDEDDQYWLVGPMTQDDHPPVRYWLANALYKRGNRLPDVVNGWKVACRQPDAAGDFARTLKKT